MGHPYAVNNVETLTGTRTITQAEADENCIFIFDPDGARTMVLPPEATSTGYVLYISNAASGAEIITINDDATNLVASPTLNEDCILFCDGVSWFGLVLTAS